MPLTKLVNGERVELSASEESAVREQWESAPVLDEVHRECVQAIDQAASRARDRFITSGVGQSAVYLSKYDEARSYVAASSPTAKDYPYLSKESARRGMTIGDLADEVIARRNQWTDPPGSDIEAERVGGKDDVRAASTLDGKKTAADNAIAALDGIRPA